MSTKITLDQWRVLQSIVDEGGYAQAAQALHRSQSSVSYAASKLQQTLGLSVLEIHGRRAQLTEAGKVILEHSRALVTQAQELEGIAAQLQAGWEPSVRLAIENVFPTGILLETLKRFEPESRGTRVHLSEEVLSGINQALDDNRVDLAISPAAPEGYLYENLMDVEFIAVAHRQHALNDSGDTTYGTERLREAVHIVIRDSGIKGRDGGWVKNEQKWTVSSFAAAIDMVANGLGFAWLPRQRIQSLLDEGVLLPLNLQNGASYRVPVNLVYRDQGQVGPATSKFISILKSVINS